MAAIIELKISDKQLRKAMAQMLARVADCRPANAGMAARMLGAVEDNFRAEGRPTKWKALKQSTLAQRALKGRSGKILQATGHLARSITMFYDNKVAGVGTNVPYAAAQNNGSKAHIIKAKNKKALAFGGKFYKKVKHPGTAARPFMVLTDRDKGDLLKIMATHITSGAVLPGPEL